MKIVGISIKPGQEQARRLGMELCGWLKRHGKDVLSDETMAGACGDM